MAKPINTLIVSANFSKERGGGSPDAVVFDDLKVVQTPLGDVIAFHNYKFPGSEEKQTICPGFGGRDLDPINGLRVLAVDSYVNPDEREIVKKTLQENGYHPPFNFWS